MHRHLNKLLVWSDGFPKLRPLYGTTTDHIAKVIRDVVSASSKFDVFVEAMILQGRLESHVHNLGVLKSVNEESELLLKHLSESLSVNSLGAKSVLAHFFAFFHSTIGHFRYPTEE